MQINFYRDQACTIPDPAGLFWRGLQNVEMGNASAVVNRAWVRWRAQWGTSTFMIFAWSKDRATVQPTPEQYKQDYWELPAGTRSYTAEGRRSGPGVQIAVDTLMQAK